MAARTEGTGEPDYGPSLPELLGPRLRALERWQRWALALAFAVVVGAAVAYLVERGSSNKTYVQTAEEARQRELAPIPFHFDYARTLKLSKPNGAFVQVERRVGGTLAARFSVSPLELGRQRGLVSGFLPIVATAHERRAALRYERFRLQFEGRARVNDVEGYQFAFTGRLTRRGRSPRQLFGRIVMLPEPFDPTDPGTPWPAGANPTRGLLVTMLATTLDEVASPTRVGDEGILQRPFRSFRFGEP